MLYVTTGANGACKTLMTLHDVRQQQIKEKRPVYYHGFTANKEILEDQFGWKPHDPEKWNEPEDKGGVPDGSILIWDECQTYLGNKRWGTKEPPKWVMDLGVYRRKRGIDIWAILPHPASLHVEVRRLVADPSFHRHFKRVFGAEASNEYRFSSVNVRCEDVKEDAEARMRFFPKEVYKWYTSTTLNTAKRRMPRKVWVFLGCAILVPVLGVLAWKSLWKTTTAPAEKAAAARAAKAVEQGGAGPVSHAKDDKPPMTAAEYVAARTPRVPGMAFTAPAYDKITEPTTAPFPAACIWQQKADKCTCFTQQATRLEVDNAVCRQIARNGMFIDWQEGRVGGAGQGAVATGQVPAGQVPARREAAAGVPGGVAGAPSAAVIPPIPKDAVDLVANGRNSAMVARPALERAAGDLGGLAFPVETAQGSSDAAIARAMRSGDWARN